MKIEVRRLPDSLAAGTRFLNAEYLVAMSASGTSTEKAPLLIFLHGSGGPKAVSADVADWAKRLAPLPIWIFHGENDTLVPAGPSEPMAGFLNDAEARNTRLTVLQAKGHDIIDHFTKPDVYA